MFCEVIILMNRLSELRKSHKLTQIQIADMLGVTQQTIFAWEHGKALPLMDNAIKLSSFYGVSIDYLLGRDDTTKKQPIDEDGLLAKTLSRVQTLSDPALQRVQDFLDGLEAGQAIGSAPPAAQDSAAGSDQ